MYKIQPWCRVIPEASGLFGEWQIAAIELQQPEVKPCDERPRNVELAMGRAAAANVSRPLPPLHGAWYNPRVDEAKPHDSSNDHQTVPILMLADGIRGGQPWNRQVVLLVYHRDGVEMLHLRSGTRVIIGRSRPAHIRINESCLSREHACFTLSEGKVIVEDLGSTNGTWVGGQKITRREVAPGDKIAFGRAVVAVVALTPADNPRPGSLSYEEFRGALEYEMVRARLLHHPLAVLVVRSPSQDRAPISDWYLQVQALLRPVDRTALYSSDTVAILLPEASLATANDLAKKITKLRSADELLVGLAALPGGGTSAEELFELCLKAAQRATPEHPLQPVLLGTWTPDSQPRRSISSCAPVSESPAMRAIFTAVARLSRASIPVLIQGETGTGKEVVAHSIHAQGPRRAGPMVCVNCGALPVHLIESTLFGHERGAFTGAIRQQNGVFEAADGGTVFLDEIGELPAAAQAALLRVLETDRVVRVGSSKEVEVNVRVIAATHRDLEAMCVAGTFRLDLLYRLNAMTLVIPPLRQRPEDILPLAERFLERASQDNGVSIRGIDPEAADLLASYSWPGNVRELRNVIERAVVIAEDDAITARELPERIRTAVRLSAPVIEPLDGHEREESGLSPAPPDSGDALKKRLHRYEAELIMSALRDAGGNRTEAAQRLGMPRRTLVHKLKVLGINRLKNEPPDDPPPAPAKDKLE